MNAIAAFLLGLFLGTILLWILRLCLYPAYYLYTGFIALYSVLITDLKTAQFMLEYHKKDPYRPWVMKIIHFKMWWWKLRGKIK